MAAELYAVRGSASAGVPADVPCSDCDGAWRQFLPGRAAEQFEQPLTIAFDVVHVRCETKAEIST